MKAILLFTTFIVSTSSFAQSYSIDWHKIAGGGGLSSAGEYTLSGTLGQSDANRAVTGGSYSLTGGFWAIYAVQTIDAPWLTISHIGNQTVVSWPASVPGYTLQTNNNLAAGAWGNFTGLIVNNALTNAPLQGNLFFRLKLEP